MKKTVQNRGNLDEDNFVFSFQQLIVISPLNDHFVEILLLPIPAILQTYSPQQRHNMTLCSLSSSIPYEVPQNKSIC